MIVVGLLAILAAIALVVLALARPAPDDQKAVLDLVVAHGPNGVLHGGREGSGTVAAGGPPGLRGALLGMAGALTARGSWGTRLAARLERAGSTRTPEGWLLLSAGTAAGGAVLLALLMGPVGLFLGAVVGLLGPHLYLSGATSRRRARFATDLPDALQLVASGLTSGYSLTQALDAVVSLGEGPVAAEVGRALAQARLGTSVEDALEAVAQRLGSADLGWVVMAIRIQRQVGGNLSEVLLSVAATVRERGWLRRHVAALSAEGKLSGYILGGMPLALGAFMAVVRPDYVARFFSQPLGIVLLVVGAVLLALGALWMRAVVRIDL